MGDSRERIARLSGGHAFQYSLPLGIGAIVRYQSDVMKRAENEGWSNNFGSLRTLYGLSMTSLRLFRQYELFLRGCDVAPCSAPRERNSNCFSGRIGNSQGVIIIGDPDVTAIQAAAYRDVVRNHFKTSNEKGK
jgi:hypothetical protein